MIRQVSIFFIGSIWLLQATVAFGQTTSTTSGTSRFTPGITSAGGGGNTFDGLSFSGVGGAILGCTNIGDSIASTVGELFTSTSDAAQAAVAQAVLGPIGAAAAEQAVNDKKANKQLEKQTKRENCLNGVAYAVAKNLLQQVSNKTLKWINTGFQGNPFYVRDIDSYYKNLSDEKVADFLQYVPQSDPIFGIALRSSITQQLTGKKDGLIGQINNTPEGQAYKKFQSDFTQGGWNSFLDPKNNALGAFFRASDNLVESINTAKENTKNELLQGSGFLSMKKCVEYNITPSNAPKINQSTVPLDEQLPSDEEPSGPIRPSNTPQINQDTVPIDEQLPSDDPTVAVNSFSATVAPKCIRYETVTPGQVIAQQASFLTNTTVRQLENADKINEVLGSFFDQLLNRLFVNGLGGLTNSGIGSGNNVVIGSNGQPLQSNNLSSADEAFGYQQINGGFNGEFDISRPQQLRAILKTQMDFVNRTRDSQLAMSRVIPTLGELDYCLPGPNPSWKIALDDNADLFFSALAGKQPDKTLQTIINSVPVFGASLSPIVGGILGLGTGSQPCDVKSTSLQLYDKATAAGKTISDYKLERNCGFLAFDDIDLAAYLQDSYKELVNSYQAIFSQQAVENAFLATQIDTQPFIRARVADIVKETGALVFYNRSIIEYNQKNSEDIRDGDLAIQKLIAINTEVESIVANAKAQYIRDRAAAGTPVNMTCIDQAYNVDLNPVKATVVNPLTGATRYEADVVDPKVQKSNDARTYFYSHL